MNAASHGSCSVAPPSWFSLYVCVCLCACVVITYTRVWIYRVRLPILLVWSADQGKRIFPCPRSSLEIWSRETGLAVPSRVSLLILHTQAEAGASLRDFFRFPRRHPFSYLNHHTSLGQSRVHRVTQLRTDGIHCREFAVTGPLILKVNPVMGAAAFASTWTN